MPPRPQKPGVGRYVCMCMCVFLNYIIQHLLLGVSFTAFPWLNSTQCSGQLCVCVWVHVGACVHAGRLVCAYETMCMGHTIL